MTRLVYNLNTFSLLITLIGVRIFLIFRLTLVKISLLPRICMPESTIQPVRIHNAMRYAITTAPLTIYKKRLRMQALPSHKSLLRLRIFILSLQIKVKTDLSSTQRSSYHLLPKIMPHSVSFPVTVQKCFMPNSFLRR